MRRGLLTLGCSPLFISRRMPLAFHIVKAFWFCPEWFTIKRWEKHAERLTVAGRSSVAEPLALL